MQIKYGFRKEIYQFVRTFRLAGVIITVLSLALADPLMYKMLQYMVGMMEEMGMDYGEVGTMYNDMMNAELVLSVSMTDLMNTALLVIMLILMSAAGGEQKKRATIIPLCSGLEYSGYLVPKFILYPAVTFLGIFASGCISGVLCNALFLNPVTVEKIILTALFAALFDAFIIAVYFAIGICTSRPGITTASVYIGMSLVQLILSALGLNDFNPFTLHTLAAGGLFAEDFVPADETANIMVSILLTAVIGVLMYLLTYSVLKAKRINNREEKPEF